MRISDWSSDVCSSDLVAAGLGRPAPGRAGGAARRPRPAQKGPEKPGGAPSDAATHHRVPSQGQRTCPGAREMTHHGNGDLHSRSEEHTSELQSLMRISYAVFCLNKKKTKIRQHKT